MLPHIYESDCHLQVPHDALLGLFGKHLSKSQTIRP